jgi:hypothetical protein
MNFSDFKIIDDNIKYVTNTFVKVEKVSKRGKELIKTYGDVWKVRLIKKEKEYLITPLENKTKIIYERWSSLNDNVLKIVEIIGK